MIYIFVFLSSICACQASGVHHNVQGSHIIQGASVLQGPPLIQGGSIIQGSHALQGPPAIQEAQLVHGPPVVTAASSQYFQRTFNRLVLAQPVLEPVIPVASPPPVLVKPTTQFTAAPNAPSTETTLPTSPQEPNIAIAIATAHAAPVATFLLPPYPFAHALGFIPPSPPINVPEEPSRDPEPTTTTTQTAPTSPESNQFTGQSSNQDFGQALPDNQGMNFIPRPSNPNQGVQEVNNQPPLPNNQGINFNQYRPPSLNTKGVPFNQYRPPSLNHQGVPFNQYRPPSLNHQGVPFNQYRPPSPIGKPQKLKTSVEVVPVPLAYIAPPPIKQVQLVKHIYKILPTKLVIRPIKSSRIVYKAVSPVQLLSRTRPSFTNLSALRFLRVIQDSDTRNTERRDIEPTTLKPLQGISPITKPPKFR